MTNLLKGFVSAVLQVLPCSLHVVYFSLQELLRKGLVLQNSFQDVVWKAVFRHDSRSARNIKMGVSQLVEDVSGTLTVVHCTILLGFECTAERDGYEVRPLG